MKKGLLSLLAVILTVVGCQNYDDQFAALNKDIAAINTAIAGLATVSADVSALKTTISGIQSGVTANGAASSALSSALTAAATDIDAIEAAVAGVASAADLTAVSTALTAVQADVKEILAANSVINQDVTINSVATLEYAESLISTKTDAPTVIVNGNVVVTTGAAVFSAAELARVNLITAKMATVLKDLTVSNTATPATTTVDFGALTFVDQSVSLTGTTSTPKLKTITTNFTIDVEGAVDYSGLTSIGGTFELDGTGVTSLNLNGVTIGGTISTTGSATAGTIFLPSATAVDVGTAGVTVLSATVATDIDLGKAAALASLSVTAPLAATVDIAATSVTGAFEIATGTPTLVYANSITAAGATTVNAVAQFHATSLVDTTGASSIAAEVVNLPVWAGTTTATMAMAGAHTAGLNLPAATLAGNALTAAAAKIITVKSTTAATLTAVACEDLTITSLAPTTNFTFDAGFTAIKTLTVTGEAATTINGTTQTNRVDLDPIGGVSFSLESINLDGTLYYFSIYSNGVSYDELKSITTAGFLQTFDATILPKLSSLTLGHEHVEGVNAARLFLRDNPELTSVKTNLTEVKFIDIRRNAKLSSIDLSSISTLPSGSVSDMSVYIYENALTGTYVNAIAATETTPYVETVIKSNDLLFIKPLLELSAASSTNTFTVINLGIDELSIGTATSTLAAAILADAIPNGASTTVTGTGNFPIDTVSEVALIVAE